MTTTLDYTVQNGYIGLPVATDPNAIQQSALTSIAAALPGWVPRESHIEVLLIEQFAAMCAETAQVAANVPLTIFAYFGNLIGITPNQGASATCLTTWTMADSAGYTIPPGTLVGFQVLGNQVYNFATTQAFTVAEGTTVATGIPVSASVSGSICNGFTPQDLVLVYPSLSYVASIASTTTTSGGVDPETTSSYLNRLSNQLQLLTPRPILASDYAALAPSVAGIARAAAFNLVNPFANQLLAQDVTFSGGVGTWTAVSGCTITHATGSQSEGVLEITSTGTANCVVKTGMYLKTAGRSGFGIISLTVPTVSTNRAVTPALLCYDVNGTLISTITGQTVTEPTSSALSPFSVALVDYTTPASTYQVELEVTIAAPAGASEVHEIAFPGLIDNVQPTNYVPDSNIQNITNALTWTASASGYTTSYYASQQNSLVYTGTGSATTVTESSKQFYLPAGTYAISAFIDATFVSAGHPSIYIWDGTSQIGALTQAEGTAGIVTGTFTLGSAKTVSFVFSTNGCTVETAEPLTFAIPQAVLGTYVPYTAGPEWTPAGQISNNERMVTVVGVDVSGGALSPTIDAALQSYLQGMREVNFIVNVTDPAYTPIDVTWSATALPGYNADTVQAAGDAALQTYLDPANWAGGNASPPYWDPTQTAVRYLSVVTLLGEIAGVAYLDSVQIGYHNASLGSSDITLIGIAPLPQPGTITGSVSPAPPGMIS